MTLPGPRPLLQELGLRPSKALGQNFLRDPNAARAIVAALAPGPADFVIEIGPGFGALTRHLLTTGARLLCVEKDRRIAAWLARQFASEPRFSLLTADAVQTDQRPLLPHGPPLVIGNLPYSVSSPLLLRWTSPLLNPPALVFTLQTELAQRVCAQPGTAGFGALTIAIQTRYHARILRRLPPNLFHPEPAVESSVVSLRRLPPAAHPPFSPARLRRLTAAAFQNRRKKILNALRPLFPGGPAECEAILRQTGISPQARPEDIPVPAWIALARAGSPGAGRAQDIHGELFDVVDERDRVIGQAPRAAVHEQSLRHRAVHIFLLNRAGELWLQRRSHLKDRHPGVWDSSASGHLDAGEPYDHAAAREVIEETGYTGPPPPLRQIAAIPASETTGWEFVRLYEALCDGPFDPPPAEVDHGEFFPIPLLREWTAARPQDFAPGFLACFQTFLSVRTP